MVVRGLRLDLSIQFFKEITGFRGSRGKAARFHKKDDDADSADLLEMSIISMYRGQISINITLLSIKSYPPS